MSSSWGMLSSRYSQNFCSSSQLSRNSLHAYLPQPIVSLTVNTIVISDLTWSSLSFLNTLPQVSTSVWVYFTLGICWPYLQRFMRRMLPLKICHLKIMARSPKKCLRFL